MDKVGKSIAGVAANLNTNNALPMIKSLATSGVNLVKQSVDELDIQQVMDKPSHLAQVSVHYIHEAAPKLASKVANHASEHPYQTAGYAVSTALVLIPGLASVPLLGGLGFGAGGVVGGTAASGMQAQHAPVVARGLFATLQSAGAGGYGVAIVNNVVRGGRDDAWRDQGTADGRRPPERNYCTGLCKKIIEIKEKA